MLKKKIFLCLAFFLLYLIFSYTTSASASSIEPPPWTYDAIDTLVKHNLADNYFVNITTRCEMAIILRDIIDHLRNIYDTKDYIEKERVSYNDVIMASKLADEFSRELSNWNCDLSFIKNMLYAFENPPPKVEKPPKRMFLYGNFQSVYLTSHLDATPANIATAYDYYNAKGFTEGYSSTNKMNAGGEFYRKDFKASFGFEMSMFNKSGSNQLSSLYGITAPERTFLPSTGSIGWILYDSVTGDISSTHSAAALLNKIWYSDHSKKFYLLLGPYYPLYTSPIVFTGRKDMSLYGPAYMPLNGVQLSGQSGQFWYELYEAVRYAGADSKINWGVMPIVQPQLQNTLPYNQFMQGFSIGSDKYLLPFLQKVFDHLKSVSWSINYLYTYDSNKGSNAPDFAMVTPLLWETGYPGPGYGRFLGASRIGPQRQTVWGGNLYLNNIIKNIDFNFMGGRSFYSPIYTRIADVNGYAYEASLTSNYKPWTLWVGYSYITPKYSPFIALDSYILDKYHNPIIPTINTFQMFDAKNYPNNTSGLFYSVNYEFKNKSAITFMSHMRNQIRSSYIDYRGEPGYIDQMFAAQPSATFRDVLANESEWQIKYYLPYKRWMLDYTYDRDMIYRNTPNFVELCQDATFYMLNLSYKLSERFFLRGGLYDYSTRGMDSSGGYRDFSQGSSSLGLNYKISGDTNFDISLRAYDYKDKTTTVNDYKATHVFTVLNVKI